MHHLPTWKRFLFGMVPVSLLLLGAEAALRLVDFRFSAWYINAPIFEPYHTDQMRTTQVFTETKPYGFPFCLDQTFRRVKPPHTLRVALVGESSVVRLLTAPMLRNRLERRYGQVEIINAGFQGCGSERALLAAGEVLGYDIDILVVYTGHNEFISFANPATVEGGQEAFYGYTRPSGLRLFQLGSKLRYSLFPPSAKQIQSHARKYSAADKVPFYASYRDHLEGIVREARKRGVFIVFGTLAYNYEISPETSPAFGAYEAVEKLSDEQLTAALREHPDEAMLDFALGARSARRGEFEKARQFIDLAMEHDQRPIRADRVINGIIRSVAEEQHVPLADVYLAVCSSMSNGLPDGHLFLDHCHLNAVGNEILQNTFADVILASYVHPPLVPAKQ